MNYITASINQTLGCIEITAHFDDKNIDNTSTSVKKITIYRDNNEVHIKQGNPDTNHSLIVYDYIVEPGLSHIYTAVGRYTDTSDENDENCDCTINYVLNDMFLFDKDNNFRIQYDPDVTSFKIITDDAIIKTLGGRYPFARRNGDAYYKQFTIGGLISAVDANVTTDQYRTGEPEPLGLSPSSTSVDDYDDMIINERQYRDRVLDFLHDGKIKIFKSNTEGIIPVRLTNISLTPNKTLGRNIWSFTAQATEMAMPNYTLVF